LYPARRRIRRQTHRTKFAVRIRSPFRCPQYPYLVRANVNVSTVRKENSQLVCALRRASIMRVPARDDVCEPVVPSLRPVSPCSLVLDL
jgi:hypothetical protein